MPRIMMRREKKMNTLQRSTKGWKNVMAGILAFFLAGGGSILARGEKPGALITVQKKDGLTIKGELLQVNHGTLRLLVRETAAKVDVRLDELHHLRISKKGSVGKGLLKGLFFGASLGGGIGLLSGSDDPGLFAWTAGQKALALGLVLGGGMGICGALIGGLTGIDESIVLDGLPPEKTAEIEAKLASRSRFRSLRSQVPRAAPPAAPSSAPVQPGAVPERVLPAAAAVRSPRLMPSRKKVSRWHFSASWGRSTFAGTGKLASIIEKAGFGSDRVTQGFWIFPGYTTSYPSQDTCPKFSWRDFRAEFSLTRKLALGVCFSPLGEHEIWGWRKMDTVHGIIGIDEFGPYFGGRYRGNAYYLTAAFMPVPDAFLQRWMLKLGGGIGLASVRGAFLTSLERPFSRAHEGYPELQVDKLEFDRLYPALLAGAGAEYFFGRHLSLGLAASYRYVPFHNGAGVLEIPYVHARSNALEVIRVNVPKERINAGGFGAGISLGIHF